MEKSRGFAFALATGLLLASACGDKVDPFVESVEDIELPDLGPESTGTTFKEMRPIFQANCVACHSASTPSGGYAFDSFAAAKSGAAKGYSAVERGTMPPGSPLSAMNRALFKDWIDNGLQEGTPAKCP